MVTFRKLNSTDFPKMLLWLSNEHVKKFWYPDSAYTFEEFSNKYGNKISKGNVAMFVISIDEIEIGYIQSYYVDDLKLFKQTKPVVGIDLFIGEIDYINKGYGPLIIEDYISNMLPNSVDIIGIDPSVSNHAAIKAYKKVGFTHVNTEFNEHEKSELYYMTLHRW